MKKDNLHIKKTGFTTPNNYFETFEEDLFDKLAAEQKIPEATGFTTPEDYFDGLEATLSAQLFTPEEDSKVIAIKRKRSIFQYISYVAAACLAIVAGIITYNYVNSTVTIDKVVNSEINTFIDNDLIALNNYEIMDVYEEENIDITTVFQVDLDATETIQYLEENADPYELLIE